MKNLILALIAVTVMFTTIGCDTKSENEKKADKIEGAAKKADASAMAGLEDYRQAAGVTNLNELSLEQLDTLRAKYVSSRQKFVSARADYSKALSDAEKHKDDVKTIGKESVVKAIETIYKLIEDIDYRIRKIDSYKADKINDANENLKEVAT